MVEDEVTDGKRIAQLLASELNGLEVGPLTDLSVTDADSDAEPSPDGTKAFGLSVDGREIATVEMYPALVTVTFQEGTVPQEIGDDSGLLEDSEDAVRVRSGAEVKRAVDLVRSALGRLNDGQELGDDRNG